MCFLAVDCISIVDMAKLVDEGVWKSFWFDARVLCWAWYSCVCFPLMVKEHVGQAMWCMVMSTCYVINVGEGVFMCQFSP